MMRSDRERADEPMGCLLAVLRLFGLAPKSSVMRRLPYRLRDDFLSAAERSFYQALIRAVDSRGVVFAKVRLADVLFVAESQERTTHQNRINQKHIDFLICSPDTLKPLCAVELDDASHGRADRKERDAFVDSACAAAGLAILHIPAQYAYDVDALRQHVDRLLTAATAPDADDSRSQNGNGGAPRCPKCGTAMVVRTATRGRHAGQQFYGCPNYPQCQEIKAL